VNRAAIEDGTTDHRLTCKGDATRVVDGQLPHELADGRDATERVALGENDPPVGDTAQPRGALSDSVEDGLDVRRRCGDDAEDLGRGRLLFLRLNQLALAGLELP
jgi:hypothetical protein